MRATPQPFAGGQAEPGQAATGKVGVMFETGFIAVRRGGEIFSFLFSLFSFRPSKDQELEIMSTLLKAAVESTLYDHLNTRNLIYIVICLLASTKPD